MLIMTYRISIFTIFFIATANIFAASADLASLPKITGTPEASGDQVQGNYSQMSVADTVKALGWVKDGDDKSFCGGHYFESDNIVTVPNPKGFSDSPMNITAVKPAFFTKHGASVVQGEVVLTQPGREITADKATFFRDDKTGKISHSILLGHVNYREYGKLIVAPQSDLDFVSKIYSLNQGVYRLFTNTPTGLANVWGRAKHAIRDVIGVLKLDRATYSTCPPDATTWHLWGNTMILDRNTGRGEVINGVLFLKKVPVFYMPYFNFPIDKNRKSGFLIPTPNSSNKSGLGLDIPYYFNLAPNYDATFTPEIFTKRGVLFDGLFRYLTPTSEGSVNIDYIPRDKAFVSFRDSATVIKETDKPALKELQESSSDRGFLSMQNKSHFDEHWQASLNVNYVSDDYFLQDFSTVATASDKDQLLNRADISYTDDHWNFLGRLQVFQTLHPITQSETQDQYKRLPQLSLSGDFPAGFGGLDYRLDSEIVNFMHRDNFYSQASTPIVGGARFNMMPSISAPLNWLGGYIVPRVQLQATGYSIHNQANQSTLNSITRLYPLISIDSGAVFSRGINFFSKGYTQTLEPRLFYLLVPAGNQNNIPLFDTYLPAFDFNQLFRTNRFSGIDRVGDANQVAAAVTTRFLDDYGQEKASVGLGQIIAIHKHQVTVDGNLNNNLDPLINEYLSPLVGQLQYFVNPKINATLNMAWDPNYHRMNTAGVNLQYINSTDRVMNFWYSYVLHGDQLLQNEPIDLNRVGFSLGWKVWRHWNIVGNMNYNISYKRAQNYLYGLEYNSCCWAMRIVRSRNFIGIGANNEGNYDSRLYIQIVLKGFGNFGDEGFGGMLASQISGYQDKITTGF